MLLEIRGRKIGIEFPMYFVAEIGANHDGDLSQALQMVGLAAEAGADAVKFQHIVAGELGSRKGFDHFYREFGNRTQHKLHALDAYQRAEIPLDWAPKLRKECDLQGVDFLTAPYYMADVEYLAEYVDGFKVGSGDFNWIEKNSALVETGKPVLLATGMSDLLEVDNVLSALSGYHEQLALLQCNSNYSASPDNVQHLNLNVLANYRATWTRLVVGISDHTRLETVPIAARALGASILERHFTDDPGKEGPDHKIALDPKGWRRMVDSVREVELALGSRVRRLESNEEISAMTQRRGLRYRSGLPKGHRIRREDITVLRPLLPGMISAAEIDEIVGQILVREVRTEEDVAFTDFV